jgi:hypothetical protein
MEGPDVGGWCNWRDHGFCWVYFWLPYGEIKMAKPGLYANINAKRKRIAAGSGEKMRKVGTKGAPTKQAFIQSAKTAKKGN